MDAEQKALKLLRLVYRLKDARKLLAILHYYDTYLKAGESVILPWPPKREKSRALNDDWRDALIAINRLLGLVVKTTKSGKKQKHLRYYLARNREVWRTVQVRLTALPRSFNTDIGNDESPGISWTALKKGHRPKYDEPGGNQVAEQTHERQRAEQELDALLFSPSVERRFKSLPVSFKMTPKLEELAAEFGPIFVERVKAYLVRNIDPKTQRWYVAEHRRPGAAPAPEAKPAPPSEVTVNQFAKAFLNKAQYPSEW